MADFSVAFPQNEEIDPERIPDINLLIESILSSMSRLARENMLDPHECEGKLVSSLIV